MASLNKILSAFIGSGVIFVLYTVIGKHLVVFSALAATIFMMFVEPKKYHNNRLVVFFAYLLCGSIGIAFHYSAFPEALKISGAVFLSLLLMAIFKLEHPPAAGISLAMTNTGTLEGLYLLSISLAIIVGISIILEYLKISPLKHK